MSTSIVAALLITGTVTVIGAKFSTRSGAPVSARTHSWLGWWEKEELICTKRDSTRIILAVRAPFLWLESVHFAQKFNIVALTKSRWDTDGSTIKDTAFVVSRTVFITRTPFVWWDDIKETWAVASFWKNSWEKEAVKQKRRCDHNGQTGWTTGPKGSCCQTRLWNETHLSTNFFFFSEENNKLADYTLNKTYVPATLPSASAAVAVPWCTKALSAKISAQTAGPRCSMLLLDTRMYSCLDKFPHTQPAHRGAAGRRTRGPCACRVTFPSLSPYRLLLNDQNAVFRFFMENMLNQSLYFQSCLVAK